MRVGRDLLVMARLHNPHDQLFKTGFREPETAAAFLRGQLRAGVADSIAWKDLHIEFGTFVDSHY